MTVWDKIYQQNNKKAVNWATLTEGIDPRFAEYFEENPLQ